MNGCLPAAARYGVKARLDAGNMTIELASGKSVVTGAANGIGFALAEPSRRAGFSVARADIEREGLEAAGPKIAALGV